MSGWKFLPTFLLLAMSCWSVGHLAGVQLFAPLARAHARKEIPKSHQRPKENLESER